MINVRIDESDLLELLMNRVEWLTNDVGTQELFRAYYSELIDSGCCDGIVLDVSQIVDNDYFNNYNTYESMDEIMKDFNITEEEAHDRIVSEYNGSYLVRAY